MSIDRATGQPITTAAAIRQSLHTILTTPVGSRTKRREFGSLIPELIDQPLNHTTRMRLQAATIMAAMRWEPRLTVAAAAVSFDASGKAQVEIAGTIKAATGSQQDINLSLR